jgi:hypothetical protein
MIDSKGCEYDYPNGSYSLIIYDSNLSEINNCFKKSFIAYGGAFIIEYYCYYDDKLIFQLRFYFPLIAQEDIIFKSIIEKIGLKSNISLILAYPPIEIKNQAISTGNISKCKEVKGVCEYTNDGYFTNGITNVCEDSCIYEIAKKNNNLELCNQITKGDINSYYKDLCLQDIAIKNNDATICKKIGRKVNDVYTRWGTFVSEAECLRIINTSNIYNIFPDCKKATNKTACYLSHQKECYVRDQTFQDRCKQDIIINTATFDVENAIGLCDEIKNINRGDSEGCLSVTAKVLVGMGNFDKALIQCQKAEFSYSDFCMLNSVNQEEIPKERVDNVINFCSKISYDVGISLCKIEVAKAIANTDLDKALRICESLTSLDCYMNLLEALPYTIEPSSDKIKVCKSAPKEEIYPRLGYCIYKNI